ncbi:MAG TPA: arginine--tRNA ligase [Candidatus Baltobacteraceae bacterium]|jgi:arginyl-tRNA synthetase
MKLLDLDGVATAFDRTARALYGDDVSIDVTFETPRNVDFGDFATNIAFKLAKSARKAPQAIATEIADKVLSDESMATTLLEIKPVAGFVNLRMQPAFWQQVVHEILERGADYGRGASTGTRLSLEFGSANPTGPLVVVQGRSLAIGSTLANAMRFLGNEVTNDWIINDAGNQLDTLIRSLYARWRQLREPDFPFPEDGYPSDYVIELAKDLDAVPGANPEDNGFLEKFAHDRMVDAQRATARRFGVDFIFQSEKVFHDAGLVPSAIVTLLQGEGLTVREDQAIALSPELDPDETKARILLRTDGRPTYFCADIVYHFSKFRHASEVLDILGPDHHGYIARVRAMAEIWRRLYGKPKFMELLHRIDALKLEGPTHWAGAEVSIDVLIAQQVSLMRGGEAASMSKRAGNIIELDEVLDEVGVDAARFFFIMLAPESPLTFDLDLAVKQSNENPVYYVQYGHARIASLIAHARSNPETARFVDEASRAKHLDRLVDPTELALARRLAEWPRLIAHAARSRAPHLLTAYAREVASDFHQFYSACKIVNVGDVETSTARLALSMAAQSVLANALAICGVSAPDFMERRKTEE